MDWKSTKTTNILLSIIAMILGLFVLSTLVVISRNEKGYGETRTQGKYKNFENMDKQNISCSQYKQKQGGCKQEGCQMKQQITPEVIQE